MDLYAENILDHYRHPRKKGSLPDATLSHHEENASCGDDLTIHLTIRGDRVEAIRWEGNGCAISQAGMSIMAEEWEGKSLKELTQVSKEDVRSMLGVHVGPRRFKCAFLCLHALKNALCIAQGKSAQTWLETVEIEN